MDAILSALFSFPTGIFTVLLLVVILYWLLVILGALDLDILDFGGDVDMDADVDMDVDADADAGDGDGHGGFLGSFGLAGVPISVAMSLLVLFGWLFSGLGNVLLAVWALQGVVRTIAAVGLLVAVLVAATLLSALLIRPLRPLFRTTEAPSREDMVGKVCTITTLRVDETFGQAEYDDGEAGMRIDVRARQGNSLGKGDRALIVSRDRQQETYQVVPHDDSVENELLST